MRATYGDSAEMRRLVNDSDRLGVDADRFDIDADDLAAGRPLPKPVETIAIPDTDASVSGDVDEEGLGGTGGR